MLWHLPLFWMVGTNQMTYGFGPDFWIFIGLVMASSIFATCCYNDNRGGTLAATLLHLTFNLSLDCFIMAGTSLHRLSALVIMGLAGILALTWVFNPRLLMCMAARKPRYN